MGEFRDGTYGPPYLTRFSPVFLKKRIYDTTFFTWGVDTGSLSIKSLPLRDNELRKSQVRHKLTILSWCGELAFLSPHPLKCVYVKYFLMRFVLWSTLKRSKVLMKTETFENVFKTGEIEYI